MPAYNINCAFCKALWISYKTDVLDLYADDHLCICPECELIHDAICNSLNVDQQRFPVNDEALESCEICNLRRALIGYDKSLLKKPVCSKCEEAIDRLRKVVYCKCLFSVLNEAEK